MGEIKKDDKSIDTEKNNKIEEIIDEVILEVSQKDNISSKILRKELKSLPELDKKSLQEALIAGILLPEEIKNMIKNQCELSPKNIVCARCKAVLGEKRTHGKQTDTYCPKCLSELLIEGGLSAREKND